MSFEKRNKAKLALGKFLVEQGGYRHHVGDSLDYSDHLPCFANRIHTLPYLKYKKDINQFISLCLDLKEGIVDTICISVTERDKYYQKWLDVADDNGYTIVGPCNSIHGAYKCWAFFVTNPNGMGENFQHR